MQKQLAKDTGFYSLSTKFSAGCKVNVELGRYLNHANGGALFVEYT